MVQSKGDATPLLTHPSHVPYALSQAVCCFSAEWIYTSGKNMVWNIWKTQRKRLYLIFWFNVNGSAPTPNKCCDLNATPTCGVMHKKCNLQCPKLKMHIRFFRNVSFFNTAPKLSYNFQDIHHYIVKLWQLCVCSMIARTWWRHQMETSSALLALCAGNSSVPVNSTHKGQWRGALMFSLICAWTNDWVNNREAGDLRCHRAHYGVIVMITQNLRPVAR